MAWRRLLPLGNSQPGAERVGQSYPVCAGRMEGVEGGGGWRGKMRVRYGSTWRGRMEGVDGAGTWGGGMEGGGKEGIGWRLSLGPGSWSDFTLHLPGEV